MYRIVPQHLNLNSETILRGIHTEQVSERAKAAPRTDQWAENLCPSRQPAAVSETGGLRGSKATSRRVL